MGTREKVSPRITIKYKHSSTPLKRITQNYGLYIEMQKQYGDATLAKFAYVTKWG